MNATEKVANSAGIAKSATGTGSSFHPHNGDFIGASEN
jgi:hypothetical protein